MNYIIKERRYCSGFTLIELLIVLSIFGILIAIAVPAFSSWIPEYRLKSAVRDLYSNMRLVKLAAIKRNTKCRLKYHSDPDGYTIADLKKDIKLADYGSDVRFEGPAGQTFAVSTITFNSRGLSNAGYAYLSNTANSSYYRVSPLTSGSIKLQKWNGSSWE